MLERRNSKKRMSVPTSKYTSSEIIARKARFTDLASSIEDILTIYKQGKEKDETKNSGMDYQKGKEEKEREKEKEKEKEKERDRSKMKRDSSMGISLSELSKKMLTGPNSARGNIKSPGPSIGEGAHFSKSMSEDESEHTGKKLLQMHVLKSSLDMVNSEAQSWQIPLIAIREQYLHHPHLELDHPLRRISLSNLMNTIAESPKISNSVSKIKIPSSICTIV